MTHPIQIYTQCQMNHAQADAYRRGFEVAKAAAIECCNEVVSWSGIEKVTVAADLIVAKIDRLKPEATQ